MTTRSKNKSLALLPESIGPEHHEISGIKLPTYKQVLLCVLSYHQRRVDGRLCRQEKIKRDVANIVKDKVVYHYDKANIKTISHKKIAERIQQFYEEYKKIQWLPKKTKNSEIKTNFMKKLEETFPFWPKNIIKQMKDQMKFKCEAEKKAKG